MKATGQKRSESLEIGARIHDLVRDDGGDLVAALKSAGVRAAQLTLPKFARGGEPREGFPDAYLHRIRGAFEEAGVRIAALSCYINPLSPAARAESDRFCRYIDYAGKLGAEMVATETGSAVSDLREYGRNRTDEIFARLVGNLSPAMEYARQKGIRVGIESVAYFPVHSARSFDRLCRAFSRNDIAAVFDPSNLLCAENYADQRAVFEEFVRMNAEKIRIVHLKDTVVGRGGLTEDRPLFEGILDVAYVMGLLKACGVRADVLVEAARSADNFFQIIQKLKNLKGIEVWK